MPEPPFYLKFNLKQTQKPPSAGVCQRWVVTRPLKRLLNLLITSQTAVKVPFRQPPAVASPKIMGVITSAVFRAKVRPNLNFIWARQACHLVAPTFMCLQNIIFPWFHLVVGCPLLNRHITFHNYLQTRVKKLPPNRQGKKNKSWPYLTNFRRKGLLLNLASGQGEALFALVRGFLRDGEAIEPFHLAVSLQKSVDTTRKASTRHAKRRHAMPKKKGPTSCEAR